MIYEMLKISDIFNKLKESNAIITSYIIENSNEIDIIYNIIKNDYKVLLYGDSKPIFDNLKSRINPTSYQKIYELYNFYKNKYKNYL